LTVGKFASGTADQTAIDGQSKGRSRASQSQSQSQSQRKKIFGWMLKGAELQFGILSVRTSISTLGRSARLALSLYLVAGSSGDQSLFHQRR